MAEDFFTEQVALGTGLNETVERDRVGRSRVRKVFAQHGAKLGFVACEMGV